LLRKWIYENSRGKPAQPQPPSRLIIYRDGVGDGLFDQVETVELGAIRQACQEEFKNYCPEVFISSILFRRLLTSSSVSTKNCVPVQIIYVVINKKHNVRFVRRDENNKLENPLPGTVVTDTITRAYGDRKNFYINAHIGTSSCSYGKLLSRNLFKICW
tara:strand:+ start:3422 stop:3898 length:477 start_codon:yes stop_codon:yes gene_type:complete